MSDNVSPDAAATFASQMRERGLDPAETLGRFGYNADGRPAPTQQPAAPAAPAPAPAEAPTHPNASTLSPMKLPSFTTAETEALANNLAKFWTGDPKVLHDALEKAGLQLVDDDAAGAPSPLEQQLERGFGGTAAADYDLAGVYVGHEADLGAVAKMDGQFRQMLQAMDFPKVAAKSLIYDILSANSQGYAAQKSDAAKAIYSAEQISMAVHATGASSRDDLLATAKVATDLIPPEIAAELAPLGVFENARVLAALFLHGQNIILRRGR